MQEKTLLLYALLTAIIGLVVLYFIPPTPHIQIRGEVTWSNDTLVRLVVVEEIWVSLETPTPLTAGTCVLFEARQSFSGYTNARVLGVRAQDDRYCQ